MLVEGREEDEGDDGENEKIERDGDDRVSRWYGAVCDYQHNKLCWWLMNVVSCEKVIVFDLNVDSWSYRERCELHRSEVISSIIIDIEPVVTNEPRWKVRQVLDGAGREIKSEWLVSSFRSTKTYWWKWNVWRRWRERRRLHWGQTVILFLLVFFLVVVIRLNSIDRDKAILCRCCCEIQGVWSERCWDDRWSVSRNCWYDGLWDKRQDDDNSAVKSDEKKLWVGRDDECCDWWRCCGRGRDGNRSK
jgi:hypothetical protein